MLFLSLGTGKAGGIPNKGSGTQQPFVAIGKIVAIERGQDPVNLGPFLAYPGFPTHNALLSSESVTILFNCAEFVGNFRTAPGLYIVTGIGVPSF